MDGGYDKGYEACDCFWGTQPGSLIRHVERLITDFSGLRVLDAGCGEGKNAAYLAERGASVDASDVSEMAINHAKSLWAARQGVRWQVADARELRLVENSYDIVIAYGLLHCLRSHAEVEELVYNLKSATRPGGINVVCTFNDRHQELHAHPGFSPVLLPHSVFRDFYSDWAALLCSDSDLHESHPHNNIPHTHSMTRIVARKEMRS